MSEVGEVVVVIGATGGLGTAIARAYAQRGARLILVGRRAERPEALADSLTGRATVKVADVQTPADLESLAQACQVEFGRVDVVVNATGHDVRRPFLHHTLEETRQLVETNLLGAIWITRAFLRGMLAQRSGVIVHLGGFADGRLAFPYYTVDSATRSTGNMKAAA